VKVVLRKAIPHPRGMTFAPVEEAIAFNGVNIPQGRDYADCGDESLRDG